METTAHLKRRGLPAVIFLLLVAPIAVHAEATTTEISADSLAPQNEPAQPTADLGAIDAAGAVVVEGAPARAVGSGNPAAAEQRNAFFHEDELKAARLRIDLRQIVAELVTAYKYGHRASIAPLTRRLTQMAPDSADLQYFEGLAAYDRGEKGQALILARNAHQKDPQMSRAASLAGMILVEAGRNAEAVAMFQAAVEVSPHNPNYLYNLANAYRLSAQPDEALQLADRAIAARRNFGEAHYLRGILLHSMRRHTDAYAAMKAADEYELRHERFLLDYLLVAEAAAEEAATLHIARRLAGSNQAATLRELARVHLHYGESLVALHRLESLARLPECNDSDLEMLIRASLLAGKNPAAQIRALAPPEKRAQLLEKIAALQQEWNGSLAPRDPVVRSRFRDPAPSPR